MLLKSCGTTASHPISTTELSVFWENKGVITAVGQLDAIYRHRDTSELCIVDFKRTNKNLSPDAHSFGKFGRVTSPMKGKPASEFYKYSLQTSIYACCISQRLGEEVSVSVLLKLFGDTEYEVVECMDLRDEARLILDSL